MSQTPSNQGAVKISETVIDTAQEVVQTGAREDGLTLVEQLRRVASDSLRKNSMILLSDGTVEWNGAAGEVRVPAGVNIQLKLLLNPGSALGRTIVLQYTGFSNAVLNGATPNAAGSRFAVGNGQVLHIELDRSVIDAATPVSGTSTINLDLSTPGQRLVVLNQGSMPALNATADGAAGVSSTISIPLAIRTDGGGLRNLWWIPHGILWSESIISFLGQITTTTTVPLGAIIALNRPDGLTNSGVNQALVNSIAPGFWLCDGSLITLPASTFFNMYTPNMNANAAPASGLPASDRTGMVPKGAATSPNTGAAYVGSSTKQLLEANLPPHAHTINHTHSTATTSGLAWVGTSSNTSVRPDGSDNIAKRDGSDSDSGQWYAIQDRNLGNRNDGNYNFTHTHTVNVPTFNGSSGNGNGTSTAFNQDPRAFTVVWIMRVI